MQTFLPETVDRSPKILDTLRLGKQVLEASQIIEILHTSPYSGHPATRMWRGYEWGLMYYLDCMHEEFQIRRNKIHKAYEQCVKMHGDWCRHQMFGQFPSWLGREEIHSSHRARLLQKGCIDELRHRIPNKWSLDYVFTKKIRDLTVAELQHACEILKIDYADLLKSSYYYRFGWAEKPRDSVIWPNCTVAQR
jgi:Pyrimidine dimer DNA glycosylase